MKLASKSSKHPLNMNDEILYAIIANLNENSSFLILIFGFGYND